MPASTQNRELPLAALLPAARQRRIATQDIAGKPESFASGPSASNFEMASFSSVVFYFWRASIPARGATRNGGKFGRNLFLKKKVFTPTVFTEGVSGKFRS